MLLYKYTYSNTGNTTLRVSILETRENKSNYSLVSNPNRRIPKDLVNKMNAETDTLYLTERDDAKARSLFAQHLRNQAEVYKHMYELLTSKAGNITKKGQIMVDEIKNDITD